MANIPFHIPFRNQWSKKPRKIRVVCIGAGLAGITLSYKISHELRLEDIIDLQIYERQVSAFSSVMNNRIDPRRTLWVAPGLRTDIPV